MDAQRFDGLAKALSAPGSRRQVLKRLAAGTLGVGAVALGARATEAAKPIWYQCRYWDSSSMSHYVCRPGGCSGVIHGYALEYPNYNNYPSRRACVDALPPG